MEELEKQAQTQTSTAIEQETKQEISLDNFPSIQDLVKSEQEVKSERKLQGLTSAEPAQTLEDRPFARKEDERKKFVKKRLKLVTGVYIAVASFLLEFVGVNVGTLAVLNKKINDHTKTIQAETTAINLMKDADTPDADITGEDIAITLNPPRDYNDDKQTLTFLDKITILFRNLFN